MNTIEAITVVCNNCNSCFRVKCGRFDGEPESNTPLALLPKGGSGTVCPLSKAVTYEPKKKFGKLTVMDTWKVCKSCRYSRRMKDGLVEIPMENFAAYCIDCACAQVREALETDAAEASVS